MSDQAPAFDLKLLAWRLAPVGARHPGTEWLVLGWCDVQVRPWDDIILKGVSIHRADNRLRFWASPPQRPGRTADDRTQALSAVTFASTKTRVGFSDAAIKAVSAHPSGSLRFHQSVFCRGCAIRPGRQHLTQ